MTQRGAEGARTAGARPTPTAPFFFLSGVLPSKQMYVYMADGRGGFGERSGAYRWPHLKYGVSIDPDLTGWQDGAYHVMDNGVLNLWRGGKLKRISSGWTKYDRVFSPGTLTRAKHPDVLARDKQGVLWRHQMKADGTMAPRVRIGAGWGQFTQIAGLGDLNGDSVPDLVARDKQGVLWMYRGTGKADAPFAKRVRIGSGWNRFNKLVATGDVDGDRRSDLLARDAKGGLWLYKGTGKLSGPLKAAGRVGTGFNQYTELF
ncbi:FG-GAP repeat domain-containing protein [Streptomyces sp. NPDC050504]|uniref:FG-GAP repeat domain-containing protein n=1 Tax=Streptomyces sp. NPDC050504 TaxID=3365618 RepID=UPI0037A6E74C